MSCFSRSRIRHTSDKMSFYWKRKLVVSMLIQSMHESVSALQENCDCVSIGHALRRCRSSVIQKECWRVRAWITETVVRWLMEGPGLNMMGDWVFFPQFLQVKMLLLEFVFGTANFCVSPLGTMLKVIFLSWCMGFASCSHRDLHYTWSLIW